MRRCILAISIIIMFAFFLAACNESEQENVSKINSKDYEKKELVLNDIEYLDEQDCTETIYFPKLPGFGTIFDYCYINGRVFYVVDYEDQYDFSHNISIHSFDMINNTHEIIYSYQNNTIGHNIIELCSDGEHLYWIEMIENKKTQWEIHQLTLSNNNEKTIVSSNNVRSSLYPMIKLEGKALVWYYCDELDSSISICKYDLITSKISFIESDLYLPTPWQKYNPDDTFLCFMKKDEENNVIITSRSNQTNNELVIDTSLAEIAQAKSNKSYVVWQDKFTKPRLFVYSVKQDMLYTYDAAKSNEEIYTYGFIGDSIYINFSDDKNGYNNLYFIDVENNTMKQITNNTDKRNQQYSYKKITDTIISAYIRKGELTGILVVDVNDGK